MQNASGLFTASDSQREACEAAQQILPVKSRLDRFRRFQYSLYLPGQYDWSTSLQQLISLGGALMIPSDLATHSLWSHLLTEHCADCVIWYNRTDDLCANMVEARVRHAAQAQVIASRLETFARSELSEACLYAYMRRVLNGLAQLTRRAEPPLRNRSTRANLSAVGFTRISCATMHGLVARIATLPGLHDPRHQAALFPARHFDAWFDPNTCVRRPSPLPLPWAKCDANATWNASDERGLSWEIDWC